MQFIQQECLSLVTELEIRELPTSLQLGTFGLSLFLLLLCCRLCCRSDTKAKTEPSLVPKREIYINIYIYVYISKGHSNYQEQLQLFSIWITHEQWLAKWPLKRNLFPLCEYFYDWNMLTHSLVSVHIRMILQWALFWAKHTCFTFSLSLRVDLFKQWEVHQICSLRTRPSHVIFSERIPRSIGASNVEDNTGWDREMR